MSRLYTGKIKVVCEDRMCFPAHAKTLDALCTSSFDPDPVDDPYPKEIISYTEWNDRRQKLKAQPTK